MRRLVLFSGGRTCHPLGFLHVEDLAGPVHIAPRQGQCFPQAQAATDQDHPEGILAFDGRRGQELRQLVVRLDIADEGLPVVIGDLGRSHGVGRIFGQQIPRDRRAQGGVQHIVHVPNGPARVRLTAPVAPGTHHFEQVLHVSRSQVR